MNLLKNLTFICLDIEATGLDPKEDRIIELAAVRFQLGKELERYEKLIDPRCSINAESTVIHGITNAMVANQPKIEHILPEFLSFIGKDIIIGHQISFDISLLIEECKRHQIPHSLASALCIDTLRLARHYGDSQKNSLEYLAIHFNIPIDKMHRAMNDVLLNIQVFAHLVQPYRSLDEIVKILNKPIKMRSMPLGKYKGRLFSEIPENYLRWAEHQKFDQDLLYSIRLELKKRKFNPGFSEFTNPFKEL